LVNQYPWEFDEKKILYRNSSLVHKIRKDSKRYSNVRTKIVLDSCLAGECGLDKQLIYQWNYNLFFEQQLLLAQKTQQTSYYSCVAAFQEVMKSRIN
jgi:Tat protein secretion system quality control protein TatD with DNase activity